MCRGKEENTNISFDEKSSQINENCQHPFHSTFQDNKECCEGKKTKKSKEKYIVSF